MANFAYVKDGVVQEAYDHLPQNWKNYSNFFALADDTYIDLRANPFISLRGLPKDTQLQKLHTSGALFEKQNK